MGAAASAHDGQVARKKVGDLLKRRTFSFLNLLPNCLTVLAMCGGFMAIRFSLDGQFELAVIIILVSAVLDFLDGRLARTLNKVTPFGAELDSLADLVSFGVAPALLMYQASLYQYGEFGWMACLVYGVCCALRLARFNTMTQAPDNTEPWKKNYFVGLPTPSATVVLLVPFFLHFQGFSWFLTTPFLMFLHTVGLGLLMISRVPTFSNKPEKKRIKRESVAALFVLFAFIVGLFIGYPWIMLSILACAYMASIPLAFAMFHRARKKHGAPASLEN